jgi:adhesin transport system outer membrane protein
MRLNICRHSPLSVTMRHVAAAAVLCFIAAPAQAQPLSLSDAYRMALQSHPSVQQRRSGIAASEQDLKAAEWQRFPTVTGEHTRQLETPHPILTNSSQAGATWRVEKPLWTGGRISSVIDAAELRRQAAEFSLEEIGRAHV